MEWQNRKGEHDDNDDHGKKAGFDSPSFCFDDEEWTEMSKMNEKVLCTTKPTPLRYILATLHQHTKYFPTRFNTYFQRYNNNNF